LKIGPVREQTYLPKIPAAEKFFSSYNPQVVGGELEVDVA
jgi:hypothetical protein